MLGGHLLAASATTQNVVAASSGEAEFYALTKSASRALVAVAMAADMAKVVKPRVRHSVEGDCLKARSGESETSPCPSLVGARGGGTPRVNLENPADMGTKHLAQREMHECLRRAVCHITGGRSRMAFRVAQGT